MSRLFPFPWPAAAVVRHRSERSNNVCGGGGGDAEVVFLARCLVGGEERRVAEALRVLVLMYVLDLVVVVVFGWKGSPYFRSSIRMDGHHL